MKPEIKKLWVDALRSGEYKQGKRSLHYEGEYCCLGVLCDVYRKETGQGVWRDGSFDYHIGTLSTNVVQWSGLNKLSSHTAANPKVKYQEHGQVLETTLSKLNDFHNYNFNQIADLIEDNL